MSREGGVFLTSASSGWPLQCSLLLGLWLHHFDLCLYPHVMFFLCPHFPHLIRTPVTGLGPILIQYDLILMFESKVLSMAHRTIYNFTFVYLSNLIGHYFIMSCRSLFVLKYFQLLNELYAFMCLSFYMFSLQEYLSQLSPFYLLIYPLKYSLDVTSFPENLFLS